MNNIKVKELLDTFRQSFNSPYTGGFRKWCEEQIILPSAFAIPGKLDLSISPYLHEPMAAIDNPLIKQINLVMATQIGKTLVTELWFPYIIINCPGPCMRIFNIKELSGTFMENRLIPLLKNCEPVKLLLSLDRFSSKKTGINLPHMSIVTGGANDGLAHGSSIKYLVCDEVHAWDVGFIKKFIARTTAFAGRRKIVIASQPNEQGSELEKYYLMGSVYEWQWECPHCKVRQPYVWNKRRNDGSFAGFNWDSILNNDENGTTNIALSSKTCWLECDPCRYKIKDNPSNRRQLNDTGKYICIKNDGANDVVSYTCPNFVNINLSFESISADYMLAKKIKRQTGLDDQMKTFVNQTLGKFYKAEPMVDISKIMLGDYKSDDNIINDNWVKLMAVDCQRSGLVKYFVVREFNKNGTESRRIDFGICRSWDEVENIRKKWNIPFPGVIIDSGDGAATVEIYQQCVIHGQVYKLNNGTLGYACWTPSKGDGAKLSYKHKDNILRYYSEITSCDPCFPQGHKLKGISAPLILWSNFSVKSILMNLRDNLIPGVSWLVDKVDQDYDQQMQSESIRDVVDKKTGITSRRFVQVGKDNHFFDCENMLLVQALRANLFSPVKINEEELKKLIPPPE